MLRTTQQAYQLLNRLGASDRLLAHALLVTEVAEMIVAYVQERGFELDSDLIYLGAAVHDAGKIIHPNELNEPGNNHEPAGQKLLLEHGVQENVARCCMSHARYNEMEVCIEELVVALADKLWKGKRVPELEEMIITIVTRSLGKDQWDLFSELDICFEKIAAQGDWRLKRSMGLSNS